MKELMAKYGIKRGPLQLEAAERVSVRTSPTKPYTFPRMAPPGMNIYTPRRLKRRPSDLIRLSESPLPARAIRLIRNGIASMDFGLQPKDIQEAKGKEEKFKKAIQDVRNILDHPNAEDDDFSSFIGQVVEDILIFDAGVWEYVEKPLYIDENKILALEVVPGYTMAKNVKWKGDPKKPRWVQVTDDGTTHGEFLDSQIEYISQRRRSFDPFGLSPLETALEIMDSIINVGSYQKNIASEAYPSFMFYLGDDADDDQRQMFKHYWEVELRGRGTPGFFGGMGTTAPSVLQLKPTGDEGLYLQYTEMLTRVLAVCFDLHPIDLGTERDVNYNTANVSVNASVQEARKPLAQLIRTKINAHLLPRISKMLNEPLIADLEFFWPELSQKDMKLQSEIDTRYANIDAVTIDEVRAERDLDPLPNDLGKLTVSAFKKVLDIDPFVLLREDIQELLEEGAKMGQEEEFYRPGASPEEEEFFNELSDEDKAILQEKKAIAALRGATRLLKSIN